MKNSKNRKRLVKVLVILAITALLCIVFKRPLVCIGLRLFTGNNLHFQQTWDADPERYTPQDLDRGDGSLSLNFHISHECLGESALSEYTLKITHSESIYTGPYKKHLHLPKVPVPPDKWGEYPIEVHLYHPEKNIFSYWTNTWYPDFSACRAFEIELYCYDRGDFDEEEVFEMDFQCQ